MALMKRYQLRVRQVRNVRRITARIIMIGGRWKHMMGNGVI